MQPIDTSLALAAIAGVLTLVACVAGLRSGPTGSGAGLAVVLLGCALAALASALVVLSSSVVDARALANTRHEVSTELLARTAGARLALDVRLDEVTAGLREELQSRDRDRSRLDEAVATLRADLQAQQVANTKLRRMLVDVAGTHGLLITREGRFRGGPDRVSFEPCGWGEAWLLDFSPSAGDRQRLTDLLDGRDEVLVTFTGVLSTPGAYGPGGASRHLFVVVDGEPSERADCG